MGDGHHSGAGAQTAPRLDAMRADEKALTLPKLEGSQPSCPEWCSSVHTPGDLEAGKFVCSHSTLEADGLTVGVQRAAYLDAGEVVHGAPKVFVIGLISATLTPQTAGRFSRALPRATAYAVWRIDPQREALPPPAV